MTRLPLPCSGPECWRLSTRAGLCDAHYMQRQRDERAPLRPLRSPPGSAGKPLLLSPSAELRTAIEKAARTASLSPQQWILRLLARALGVGE